MAALTALERLHCGNSNNVTHLAPLARLVALRRLSLVSSGVSDLTPLAGLTALEKLDVGRTRIASLEAVAGLTALRSLCCSHNTAIADLGPLTALVAMIAYDSDLILMILKIFSY